MSSTVSASASATAAATAAATEEQHALEEQLLSDLAASTAGDAADGAGAAAGDADILTLDDGDNGDVDLSCAPEVDAMAAEIVSRARAAMAEMDAVVRNLGEWRDSRPAGPGDSDAAAAVGDDADYVEHEISEEKYAELVRPATSEAADASVLRVRARIAGAVTADV